MQAIAANFLATNPSVPSLAFHVDMPRLTLSWSTAVGFGDRSGKLPLRPEHPVRIASVTKPFVAVAILRLWEKGALSLDAPAVNYLTKASAETLKAGGYDVQAISVRHLLTHTSGIYDFAQSDEYNRAYEANPNRRWTRAEQLSGAMIWGRSYGEPGKVLGYSDTGYILLGEMLEVVTGKSMGGALRELVGYKAIGLQSTWHETLEREPPGVLPRAHQYNGDRDTYTEDPSADLFGGGGLVSTVGDMARFMRGVFAGPVFEKPGTRETMLTTVPVKAVAPPAYGVQQVLGRYRMGIRVKAIGDWTVYSHGGYWGTMAAYVPKLDLAFGLTVNQLKAREQMEAILHEVIRTVSLVDATQKRKMEQPVK